MKLAIVALLVLAAIGMSSAGACWRRKCSVHKVYFYPACCPYYRHSSWVRFCRSDWYYCGRKRESDAPKDKVEVGFPCDFNEYDLDKNGSITQQEFTKATKLSSKEVADIFKDLDKDNNGLSCNELKNLEFTCKLTGCDAKNDEPWY